VKIFSPKLWLGAVAALTLGLSAQTAQASFTTGHLLDARGTTYGGTGGFMSDTGVLANNGFQVVDTKTQPAGTGVIDPFVRIQMTGQERGYNTSLGFPLDVKHPDNYTHAIQLGDIPLVTLADGNNYREFLLDVNQTDAEKKNDGNISLNQIQIFQSAADAGTTFGIQDANNTSGGHNAILTLGSTTEVFRLNNRDVADPNIEIWANEGNGSGTADMLFYVRNEAFTGGDSSYITLFSQFGRPNGTYASDAGFEEWAVRQTDAPGGHGGGGGEAPAPAGLVLLASAVPMMAFRRVFRRKMAGN